MFLGLGEIEVVFLCLALYDTQPILGYILPFFVSFLKNFKFKIFALCNV